MANPAMALVFVVGIGLATILYYMFSDSNNSHEQNAHQTGDGRGGGLPPEMSNSWTPSNNNNNNTNKKPRRRRKASNTSDRVTNCTICLTEISRQQKVIIQPCGHSFHKKCIQEWQQLGQMEVATCPNCRMEIKEVVECNKGN